MIPPMALLRNLKKFIDRPVTDSIRGGAADLAHTLLPNGRVDSAPFATHIRQDRRDLLIGDNRAETEHFAVVGFAAHLDWTAQAVEDNSDQSRFRAAHPRGAGQRRTTALFSRTVRLVTGRAVHFKLNAA